MGDYENTNGHPVNGKQEKALKAVFDALKVDYVENQEMDETERILSNPDMAGKLNRSIAEVKEGRVTKVAIEDLWK